MKIICISGRAQHGKDTTAGFLAEALEQNGSRVLITHYADLLKYICKTFFAWNGEKDDAGRTLLQHVGTDIVRKRDPDYWVNFMISALGMAHDLWDYVIIPDCRFPNEIEALRRAGFNVKHIKVVRTGFFSPLSAEQQNHPSETALDDVTPDITLYNSWSLNDLRHNTLSIAKEF